MVPPKGEASMAADHCGMAECGTRTVLMEQWQGLRSVVVDAAHSGPMARVRMARMKSAGSPSIAWREGSLARGMTCTGKAIRMFLTARGLWRKVRTVQ